MPGLHDTRVSIAPAGDWSSDPSPPNDGLKRSLEALKQRWWFVALLVALTVGVALVTLPTIQKVYQARSTLHVQPVSSQDTTLLGLGLPEQTADPTRDVETFAQLITTSSVARRVQLALGLKSSPSSILKKVSVQPLAQSDVLAITARANSPDLAMRLANAYANAAIAERTALLHKQTDLVIPSLQSQIAQLPAGDPRAADLTKQLQELKTLRTLPDPTITPNSAAETPTGPVSPRRTLSLAAAAFAGLVLGVGAVLLWQLLDTRLRGEEELRRYRIPILARVPLERKRSLFRRKGPLRHEPVSTADPYSVLAATVAASCGDESGRYSVLVTGSTPSEGKTTTSLNLAASLSAMDKRVVLIEADPQRPTLGAALGLEPIDGLPGVTSGRVGLADALVQADGINPRLRVLLQPRDRSRAQSPMTGEAADSLVRQAALIADWAVFDAPPPNFVSDGLTIAKHVDFVVLVVRLGHTHARELGELVELLSQQGVARGGFVVIGGKDRSGYYYAQ